MELSGTPCSMARGSALALCLVLAAPLAVPAREGFWTQPVIGARDAHSAIYDPARARMVVFGGGGVNGGWQDVWTLALAGTPEWSAMNPDGPLPRATAGHVAIHDPVRRRMIVFGGGSAHGFTNEVWALALEGAPGWTQLHPSGIPPVARAGMSAVYDPIRDRMLVFGGVYVDDEFGFSRYANDIWELSLGGEPAWTELAPAGTPPAPRCGHGAIYDPARDRMLVFGGEGDTLYFFDVWALSLSGPAQWSELRPSGPVPGARSGASVIHDPRRDRMLVYGGAADSSFGDTWSLSLAEPAAWMKEDPAGPVPVARAQHSAILDPGHNRMVVFGGWDGTGPRNDAAVLALAGPPAWSVPVEVPATPGLYGFRAVHDVTRARMVLVGYPAADTAALFRAWSLPLAGATEWTAIEATGLPPDSRSGFSAVYDERRDRILVFGGYRPPGRFSDEVWSLSLAGTPAWTPLAPAGTGPMGRCQHSAIYDPVRDAMIVYGGCDAYGICFDAWSLSLADPPTWSMIPASGPGSRWNHSAIYDPVRDQMVVYGGYGSNGPLDDTWALRRYGGIWLWSAVSPGAFRPLARDGHSAVYDPARNRMVVFGGATTNAQGVLVPLADTWTLSLAGAPSWTSLQPAGSPPAEGQGHAAIWDPARDRMVVYRNDLWTLWMSPSAYVGVANASGSGDQLRAPFPSPFRALTTIGFSLAQAGVVQVGVFDAGGRRVRTLVNGPRPAGPGILTWDGTGEDGTRLGSGLYFIELVGPGGRASRKVVRLR
jgi:hypothetical protein